MSKIDHELLDKLTAWMEEGGFTRLTYTRGKRSVTLRRPEGAQAKPRLPAQTITSPSIGVFTPSHPLAAEPYAAAGSVVRAGEIVGLLSIGPVLLPVEAPCTATVRRVLLQEGALVGFGDPLFEIEPMGGQDED